VTRVVGGLRPHDCRPSLVEPVDAQRVFLGKIIIVKRLNKISHYSRPSSWSFQTRKLQTSQVASTKINDDLAVIQNRASGN
jgi:hypothetical protein